MFVLVCPGSSKTDYGSFGLEANVRIICNKENGSDEDTGEVNCFFFYLLITQLLFVKYFFIDSLGKKRFILFIFILIKVIC